MSAVINVNLSWWIFQNEIYFSMLEVYLLLKNDLAQVSLNKLILLGIQIDS